MTHCGVPAKTFVADLHIHSKYSRACSRDLELDNLTWWARRKGITLLGTGDFTHPAWFAHLQDSLEPAEQGLYRLKDDRYRQVAQRLPRKLTSAEDPVRFQLSVEISTIYKRAAPNGDDRTRKVHHLVYLPDFESVERFNTALGRIGNLGSDGRPILGLDSRDLLEITLDASPDGYLVPAHIWTPWFSAMGSKSGFDAIEHCYADLADHIFAVETGLSSDPEMNWRVSSLDRYRLVSNSDAHSPQALAREATIFETELTYHAVREAMRTGAGLKGTLEFFPEEGKYHADGHRACGVNWQPAQTRETNGMCPECGKPLTVGVLHRVEELADRPEGYAPDDAPDVTHLLQLHEVLGEVNRVGAKSKTVETQLQALVNELGSELSILRDVPVDDIAKAGGELLGEAITRLRARTVRRIPGYDGEYGVIRIFEPSELETEATLFDVPVVPKQRKEEPRRARPVKVAEKAPPLAAVVSPHEPLEPMLAGMEEVGTGLLDRLDAMQRVAASAPGGPILIVAGPGTGKTRTLTHRIAYLCAELGVYPEQCLAITFTRRAAEELRHRLDDLLGEVAADVTVATFHSLGLSIVREHSPSFNLSPDFRIAEEADRITALVEAGAASAEREARRQLNAGVAPEFRDAYRKALRSRDLVDLDELITLPVELLTDAPDLVEEYRAQYRWIFVDEYQDVDPVQYDLLRLLCPPDGNLTAIGDPDQAIYSFRGADVGFFLRFTADFTDARQVRLTRNYRSAPPILAAAVQAIAPSSLVPGRRLDPAKLDPEAPQVGLYAAASAEDEAVFVSKTIDELVGGVTHRTVDSRAVAPDAVSFADIAVLYRTDAQASFVVDALNRHGVPVQKRSHDRLLDRPGVAAIARELRFASGLGGSLAARVKLTAQVLAERPALDVVVSAEDLWSAVDLLGPLALRCGDDLGAFLTALETGAEVDAWDPRADRVTLLTLHAAKGLEFPIVFLVGCEDGLLPLRRPGNPLSAEEEAEERRLFFVGLTRAQDRLYVSHARKRFRHGSEREMAVTPFLSVIDPGLFERKGPEAPRRPKDRQLRLI
ncbi:UvrD-helicase domain-containing protein [Virgisporangium ochraceum]|uniref:DNA 3'-5' helicase n=1 Tax=Virgisporangium ochraceum TaxID=65505 RepID=A0A8J3ZQN5_9ACTN|nr:UvrD-helicase domain-containing protein [Virgisporangium ochraceum]GIJ66158.1 DNA helicase [Virgisporangium ochraceum]